MMDAKYLAELLDAGETGSAVIGVCADKLRQQAEQIARLQNDVIRERAAALNLWPRDCRLCGNYTTASGGCVSVLRCVDSNQYKATTPRQYWEARPVVTGAR